MTAGSLVRRLKMSRTYAWELMTGQKTPSLSKALEIEREFGVPVTVWPLKKQAA